MSTRCQIQIIKKTETGDLISSLYGYFDGYPKAIIPIIKKIFQKNKNSLSRDLLNTTQVLSWIHQVDPLKFDPSRNCLHGDIDFLFRLFLVTIPGGSRKKPKVVWELKIFQPKLLDFLEEPKFENMDFIYGPNIVTRIDNEEMASISDSINKRAREFSKEDFLKKMQQSPKFSHLLKPEFQQRTCKGSAKNN